MYEIITIDNYGKIEHIKYDSKDKLFEDCLINSDKKNTKEDFYKKYQYENFNVEDKDNVFNLLQHRNLYVIKDILVIETKESEKEKAQKREEFYKEYKSNIEEDIGIEIKDNKNLLNCFYKNKEEMFVDIFKENINYRYWTLEEENAKDNQKEQFEIFKEEYGFNNFDIENKANIQKLGNLLLKSQNIKEENIEFTMEYIIDKKNIEEDYKLEFSEENAQIILNSLDKEVKEENKTKEKNIELEKSIEENIENVLLRKEKLTKIAINNIQKNKNKNIEKKQKEIAKVKSLSLKELEIRGEEKSPRLINLENKAIGKITESFMREYHSDKNKANIEDNFTKYSNSKKVNSLIEKMVEDSDIFNTYMNKIKEKAQGNNVKNQDGAFLKLLDYYIKVPEKVRKQQFKLVMVNNIKRELKENKDNIIEKIQNPIKDKNIKQKYINKNIEMSR